MSSPWCLQNLVDLTISFAGHSLFPPCLASASLAMSMANFDTHQSISLLSHQLLMRQTWSIIVVHNRSQHWVHSVTRTRPIDSWLDLFFFQIRNFLNKCLGEWHPISVVDSSNFVCFLFMTHGFMILNTVSLILSKGLSSGPIIWRRSNS